ncbi:single-stranded-DNA-specific exonuclease RecJ [Leptolyngbya sp. FACHB-671]|uniref:single-stranded-DNA-specific exonuclease RecJ n=1 Tax=Leptolyngbya sp. FACHB-671 TaxID=2692812 RepID=UPI0016884772|nr:single-stranded-DNA-specific exonuclease RecJ [Leptolyngbya sp. FACHB-671]MBD2070706.1 single-stranded-DNA-specific exonuclease RecJ [Leptolyngbya sp. FACHB-671]
MPEPQWQVQPVAELPTAFVQAVNQCGAGLSGYAAQLLWQRGIQDPEQVAGFVNPDLYQPTSPFEFGQEMHRAVERLRQAYEQEEAIAIWGDFDADGITATAVLWDGLGQFFPQDKQLTYFIPNRLTESHGLSVHGIDALAAQNCRLIVTCDTGSTNLPELEYAKSLGIDVIVTDHHTLPSDRPPVTAIINPRYFPPEHPLAHLSGVAVSYKLIEALYQTLPNPDRLLEGLLDLVAIGLIADLVQLTGDCRYLAQRGIEQLQKNTQAAPARPGIARLLELCKRSGDRPTDISFGIGPRINAISRIHGDARFGVELLTSQDAERCRYLAEETELANARRKALQKDLLQQVTARLAQIDLSTTSVIVLADPQWPVGVLGLVAGQIAQTYGRPTILLTTESTDLEAVTSVTSEGAIARGSARSVNQIDLYQLVKEQSHLLTSFGGHPYAAGLSLTVQNLPLFTEAINRQFRQQFGNESISAIIRADLTVTVAELGKDLFREIKLLEPYGMGNLIPRLLLLNCWFRNVRNQNIKDWKGRKIRYIKTEFDICDDSTNQSFPGIWWEHYRDEIPPERCDAIAELDYNTYKKRYEIRLIALRPRIGDSPINATVLANWILDWRQGKNLQGLELDNNPLKITHCPSSWTEMQSWFRRALQENRKLAIAYLPPSQQQPSQIWQQLVGIAKYLSRTGQTATRKQLHEKLGIGDRSLQIGFKCLKALGFEVTSSDQGFQITWQPTEGALSDQQTTQVTAQFLSAVQEEQFHQQYFYEIPLPVIQSVAQQTERLGQAQAV